MFARSVDGQDLRFGVSGLVYRSNVLMYDRETESLWSQVQREAVTGPMAGRRLRTLPMTITTWSRWRSAYPDTRVLSPDTGYRRDYSRDPYEDYYRSSRSLFSLLRDKTDKTLVVGLPDPEAPRAVRLDTVRRKGRIVISRNGAELELLFDHDTDRVRVRNRSDGSPVAHILTYAFVWRDFYPSTIFHRSE